MESSELRLGNYVKMIDSECEVVNINHLSYMIKCEIKLISHPFDPIPLTADWLLRLGFLESQLEGSGESLALFGDVNIHYYNSKIYIELEYEYAKLEYIKYVHQLQNLYFALVGEELTIKN